MRIDILSDDVLRLSEAAKILPRGRSGKKVHVSTLWRWSSRGIRGVKLETVRMGGLIYTSRKALQGFFGQLNQTENLMNCISGHKQRRATRVRQRLKGAGLLS